MLSTARTYQQPPTAWLGGDGSWTDRDRVITLAHTMYEAGLCPECGHHTSLCRGSHEFVAHVETCNAKAAIERKREEISKSGDNHGVVVSARVEDEKQVVYGANPYQS